MMDFDAFWKGLAENPPEESQQREFEDLPDGAFVLMETASKDNGQAAPKTETRETKIGPLLMFKTGLLALGGDGKTADKHLKAMVFLELFVRPGPKEEENAGSPLGGRFTGFLNHLFAAGIHDEDLKTRHAKRWAATMKVLRETAQTYSLTLEQYEGDQGAYLAALAAVALVNEPRSIIIKTKQVTSYKNKEGVTVKLEKPRVEVSMMEDAVPSNLTKRQIKAFKAPEKAPAF